MYGALLAERDDRISALALQAPDAAGRTGSRRTGSSSRATPARSTPPASPASSPSDAVARLADRLGDRLLLQWAGNDTFVTAEARAAYERADPQARSISYEGADHLLDDRAANDLVAFLAEQLGLDQN